jgi:spore coat protein U-like protein
VRSDRDRRDQWQRSGYGRIPEQMTPAPATYTDTITVTVTY